MSYEPAAAEVAEDFKNALEDMSTVLRVEIMNLCQIARENTEFAFEISEVLQNHIFKAPPKRKLPALYVLDAIVKNVGTPYTLYLAPKLYSTFMEAYLCVDMPVRRKMEEMLRTWKAPVPGSMDTRPVFPPEVVNPIESALMKGQQSALQAQQENLRGQQHLLGRPRSAAQSRDTPTPPGMRPGSVPRAPFPQDQYRPQNGNPPVDAHQAYQYPPHQVPFVSTHNAPQHSGPSQPAFPPPHGHLADVLSGAAAPGGINIDSLNKDIHDLIVASQTELSKGPYDASTQTRLKALMDLQKLLQARNLPQEQLVLVKDEVAQLAVKIRGPPGQNATPASNPVAAHPRPPAIVTPSPAPVSQAPVTIDSILGVGALAALLARQPNTPQTSTPVPTPPGLAIRSPPPQHVNPPAPTTTTDAMALLSQLRQAGLVPGASSAQIPLPAIPGMGQPPPMALPPVLANIISPQKGGARRPLEELNDIALNAASLKQQFRGHLLPLLFEDLGPQCTLCGRRFKTDEEGKKKKDRHLDWHFGVVQRAKDAEKRGQHRSWYVDKLDWVNSREAVDAKANEPDEASSTQDSGAAKAPQVQYIPVPDPSKGISNVCPICQERFENTWLASAQDWVWLDAMLDGNRAYHISCHEEAKKARESTPMYARNTPEPVLGKRRADMNVAMQSPKRLHG